MSSDPVNVIHKRGQGRPAPGELEAGEIGINISSLPTDLDIHGLWDCYVIEPARAFTADEEGVIHAIGDWESLAPSPIYGDVAYQTAYTEAADARLRPGWQQALMNFKNYAAFGGSAGSFPIPLGGDASDIDVDKYLHNFASIKFMNQHGRYTGENFDVINPPVARLKAEGLLESDKLDKTVTFEIHCLNLTVMTEHEKYDANNTQFFLPEQTKGKDLSKDGSGTYLTQQLYLNAPKSVLSEFELGTHWQIHDDFMERPDEALCVWGGAAFPGGTIRASSSRVPDDPVEGMMYFNTAQKQFVGYDGSEWASFNGADDGGDFVTKDASNTVNNSFEIDNSDRSFVVSPALVKAGKFQVEGELLSARPDAARGAFSAGMSAGTNNQGQYCTAVGSYAGRSDQSQYGTALGYYAGKDTQGEAGVAIGQEAGSAEQGFRSVAIGYRAGKNTQSIKAISIGHCAGENSQNSYSVAIGMNAGQTDQGGSGIIISSGSAGVNNTKHGHIVLHSPNGSLTFNGSNKWTFDGGPVQASDYLDADGNSIIGSTPSVSPTQLIETLSTLRDATRDETTVEGLRDSIGNAIGGLIEKFEATLQ